MNVDIFKEDPTLQKNRNGWWETNTHRQCTHCKAMFEKNPGNTSRLCKLCNCARVKDQNAEVKMYRRAKHRAQVQGITFTITVEDITIPSVRPVLGIPIYVTKGRPGGFNSSPSLDQINPGKGYTPDNIMVMSQLANAMKANALPEQLLAFSKWIIKTYSEDEINESFLT
jgi:hypothetical protein